MESADLCRLRCDPTGSDQKETNQNSLLKVVCRFSAYPLLTCRIHNFNFRWQKHILSSEHCTQSFSGFTSIMPTTTQVKVLLTEMSSKGHLIDWKPNRAWVVSLRLCRAAGQWFACNFSCVRWSHGAGVKGNPQKLVCPRTFCALMCNFCTLIFTKGYDRSLEAAPPHQYVPL